MCRDKKKKALKTSAAGMHKKVKEIAEEEIYSLVGCIKPQDLTIIVRNKRHLWDQMTIYTT